MLTRVRNALAVVVGFLRSEEPATDSSESTPGRTQVPIDPETARRDRVRGLLEANGGRVWQQDVVAALDCSAASVSRVLCEMEADDEIARYWKQGQKVVALPPGEQAPAPGSSARNGKQTRVA